MSIATRTTYLAKCDYPDCHMAYDFWASSTEDAVENIIDEEEWLCLFTGDNEPRFFCPLHLRYDEYSPCLRSTVFYDAGNPDMQTSLPALNQYYEDMSTLQPLPRPDCESSILAVLADFGQPHSLIQGLEVMDD